MTRGEQNDEWEETQQSHRRFPVRGNKHGKRHFDVASTFGTYTVKCAAVEKHRAREVDDLTLDIHSVTEDGDGMEGSFDFGVLTGMMLFAGSRAKLSEIVAQASAEGESAGEEEDEDQRSGLEENSRSPVQEMEGSEPWGDEIEVKNRQFEKNTFRTPKFWFAFRTREGDAGVPAASAANGFMEFSGNACKEFKGTFTSQRLGKDVAFSGFKIRSKPSVCPYVWSEFLQIPLSGVVSKAGRGD